jgi:hypothetical protein
MGTVFSDLEGILLWITYRTYNNHWWHTCHRSSKLKTAQQERWPGNMTSGVLLSSIIWNDKIRNQTIHSTVQTGPPVIIICSKTWRNTFLDFGSKAVVNFNRAVSQWFEDQEKKNFNCSEISFVPQEGYQTHGGLYWETMQTYLFYLKYFMARQIIYLASVLYSTHILWRDSWVIVYVNHVLFL